MQYNLIIFDQYNNILLKCNEISNNCEWNFLNINFNSGDLFFDSIKEYLKTLMPNSVLDLSNLDLQYLTHNNILDDNIYSIILKNSDLVSIQYRWFNISDLVLIKLNPLVYKNFNIIIEEKSKKINNISELIEESIVKFNNLRVKNERVYYSKQTPSFLNIQSIYLLKGLAVFKKIPIIRICLHQKDDELIHEMIIIHTKPQKIGPLKQNKKSLSYHIIDGTALINLHDDNNKISWQCELSSTNSKSLSNLRLNSSIFRTIESISNYTIFLEISSGPFIDNDTIWM